MKKRGKSPQATNHLKNAHDHMAGQAHSQQSSGVAGDTFSLWTWWGCLSLIILAGGLAYSNSFSGIQIFDDAIYIKENAELLNPSPPSLFRPIEARPVVRWTLWWNFQLSGYQLWSYHLVNLIAHLAASLLLFDIVRMVVDRKDGYRGTGWRWIFPLSIALIWVVHPLNTQAVTYIIQRCESMMGMFMLLTLWTLARVGLQHYHPVWLIVGILSAVLGMGCKQVMVVIPIVALMFDCVFIRQPAKKLFLQRGWFYAGLLILSSRALLEALGPVVDSFVSQYWSTPSTLESAPAGLSAGFNFQGFTKWEYFRTQPEIILHYLRLCIWPDPLCLDYRWLVQYNPMIYFSCGFFLLALLLCGLWLLFRRHPVGFLIVTFFTILAPTSSIMPINDMALEHRMYLPLVCVIALFCLLLKQLSDSCGLEYSRVRFLTVANAVCVALGVMTFQRNFDYHNEVAVWESVVEAAPHNDRGWRNLAHYYILSSQFEKSLDAYEHALEILDQQQPTPPQSIYGEIYNGMGEACKNMRDIPRAMTYFQRSIKANPNNEVVYQSLGRLYGMLGDLNQAGINLKKANSLNPQDGEIHYDLGNYYMNTQEFDLAIEHFQRAWQILPFRFEFGKTLAGTYANLEQYSQAISVYDQLLAKMPQNAMDRLEIEEYRRRCFTALKQTTP